MSAIGDTWAVGICPSHTFTACRCACHISHHHCIHHKAHTRSLMPARHSEADTLSCTSLIGFWALWIRSRQQATHNTPIFNTIPTTTFAWKHSHSSWLLSRHLKPAHRLTSSKQTHAIWATIKSKKPVPLAYNPATQAMQAEVPAIKWNNQNPY